MTNSNIGWFVIWNRCRITRFFVSFIAKLCMQVLFYLLVSEVTSIKTFLAIPSFYQVLSEKLINCYFNKCLMYEKRLKLKLLACKPMKYFCDKPGLEYCLHTILSLRWYRWYFEVIHKHKPNKKRKKLMVFDDIIADMLSNKKLQSIVIYLLEVEN